KKFRSKGLKEEERGSAAAMEHGAKAVLFIHPIYSAEGLPADVVIDNEQLKMVGDPLDNEATTDVVLPNATIGPKLSSVLLDSIGMKIDNLLNIVDLGEPLTPCVLPVTVKLQIAIRETHREARNVAAILEGGDPHLKKEYLMLSAHYDHLESSGDNLYLGADDDGSGTSAVLAIARALAMGKRPRR